MTAVLEPPQIYLSAKTRYSHTCGLSALILAEPHLRSGVGKQRETTLRSQIEIQVLEYIGTLICGSLKDLCIIISGIP